MRGGLAGSLSPRRVRHGCGLHPDPLPFRERGLLALAAVPGVAVVDVDLAGGDAPGVKFENCYWCQEKEIAAICTDTWGVEVRPNETTEANQPWHWVVIPAMGLCMGEIFYLKELAEDCDEDGIYEFFFCGPPLIITGGTGSPINPQAIK